MKAQNRSFYLLTCVIIFALLTASMFVFIILPRGHPLEIKKTDELFGIVEDGDIICRLGNRLWSEIFSGISVTDKRFSHMGIIRIHNDIVTVIHAEGNTGHGNDSVSEVPLDDFLLIARKVGVYRINNIDADKISRIALEYVGIPFDWEFDMHNDSKIYCTELLYIILKRIAPAMELNTVFIEKLGKEIIPLEAISNSEHFTEVYYNSKQ